MARTQTRTDEVICYRLLVESFYDGEWHEVLVYGPYFKKGQAAATIDGAENRGHLKALYTAGKRRARVQKQYANEEFDIFWGDVA